ncbi:MAG TPA: 2-oxo-4-hydroxy-4-carboxy-5-ureidoimidazoline decarboxylase [Candidatus Dormibacteraeota bacterium]|nr:2-oxo-4-hydroxy-4-carboxy-5-ureidoimidazoline decarboxylase [Candidatus Dormibacteraeota bacterium]HEX2682095.1 2-oxo-4-hydroxy-4-carboxy-5-ureidoimidazoline decarboxylase [Candidatus Dormibacteraeota bacterium]
MSDGLDRFNEMPIIEAQDRLYACLANQPWAKRVADGRPYRDVDQLLAAAESAWTDLGPGDWLQAFKAHPRIGEGGGYAPATSEREQSGVGQASASTLAALAAENRAYEARFGHVFLIAARGRGADEILHELRRRMSNDAFSEVEVATAEHKKITRMRLMELVA